MKNSARTWALAVAVALTPACAASAPPGPTGAARATLAIQPVVKSGLFRAQPVITPYTKTSVQHLVLALFAVSGGTETAVTDGSSAPIQKDVPNTGMDAPVLFTRLHQNTAYRVRAYAYKAAGNADGDLISDGERSYIDVVVGTDDRPDVSTVQVYLVDQAFAAQGSGSLSFVAGGYSPSSESFTVAAP